MTYRNLWDEAREVIQRKFISLTDYIRKEESLKSNISVFTFRNQKKEVI